MSENEADYSDERDLAVRPILHRNEDRIEAHIFVAFLAYCPQVTLKANLRSLAGGLTPREVRSSLPDRALRRMNA